MSQPREALDDTAQGQWSAIAVLDIDSVDDGMDQVAFGIGQDMALASLDFLACIITLETASFRGFTL